MSRTVRIPTATMVEIDIDVFTHAAQRFAIHAVGPKDYNPPRYALFDTVEVTGKWGQVTPGVIIGIMPEVGGWRYEVATPIIGGQTLERSSHREDRIGNLITP